MNAAQAIAPKGNANPRSETGNPLSPFQPPAERFDAFIGRAMARPGKPDQRGEADALSRSDEKERKTKKTNSRVIDQHTSGAEAEVARTAIIAAVPTPFVPPPAVLSSGTASGSNAETSDSNTATSEASPITALQSSSTENFGGSIESGVLTTPGSPVSAAPDTKESPWVAELTPVDAAAEESNAQPIPTEPAAESATEKKTAIPTAIHSSPPPDRQAESEGTGISGAKYVLPMEKAEKMNEFSGSAEQNLPAGGGLRPGAELSNKATRPVRSFISTENTGASPFPVTSTTNTSGEVSSGTFVQQPSPLSLQSLERTQELLSLHAIRLRESGKDSMSVVIKPGPGLHLSLDLQMRDGNVEMRALLHQGDFDLLSRHWTELQQQMESRGIRLAPLLSGQPNADTASEFSKQSSQRHAADNHSGSGGSSDAASSGAVLPKNPVRKRSQGWESWA
jgi:hypothetical protein